MTARLAAFRTLVAYQARIALAVTFFAALTASGQAQPVSLMPSCSPTGRQPPTEPSLPGSAAAEPSEENTGVTATEALIQQLQSRSFQELAGSDLRVRTFHSHSDYLRTRFSVSRFLLLMPMRYFIDINPALFREQAPPDGVCAILAHELAHVVSLQHGNRIRRLGLVRLLSRRYTARFERRTDLEAIHRGYCDGLKSYRSWVYAHIPASNLREKRRNYFSPEEIAAIEGRLKRQPDLLAYWSHHVPLNLQSIQADAK